MSTSPFEHLAPFIQEYIYKHEWAELRDFQAEACNVVFNTDNHLLLSSPTASGKTEAAFLPALTEIHNNPPYSIGILYVCPLKALINDQFYRLNELLADGGIKVTHWHGDVSRDKKQRLVDNPSGVLQITPESLEAIVINKMAHMMQLFGDLRFVIIDEVHAFMHSDRGLQVLSLLSRIARHTGRSARRIGLSATLGDNSHAANWLRAGTQREVSIPKSAQPMTRIAVSVQHFSTFTKQVEEAAQQDEVFDRTHSGESAEDIAASLSQKDTEEARRLVTERFYNYVYDQSHGYKALIFANAKGDVEECASNMKDIAEKRGDIHDYYVHHGSVAAVLRESAERAMRSELEAVTIATITMELGIDIGRLQRVLQLEAPMSVSSFVQRLGRSGRRGDIPSMYFASLEREMDRALAPELMPWAMVQNIAIIQLYIEERFIEPLRIKHYPFSLLYHQTLSTLKTIGETPFDDLVDIMCTNPVFAEIEDTDVRIMLRHLIDIEHITEIIDGGLILGIEGERVTNNYRFYAVFKDDEEYTVKHKSKEVGTLPRLPPLDVSFALAGQGWHVTDIDVKKKVIYVVPTKGKVKNSWNGGSQDIHTKILRRMRQVLDEDTEYRYLATGALERLRLARRTVYATKLTSNLIIPMGGDAYAILPWCGTRAFNTLIRYLRMNCGDIINITNIRQYVPYYIIVQAYCDDAETLYERIMQIVEEELSPMDLVGEDSPLVYEKYDMFLPNELLKKSVAYDMLDVPELKGLLEEMRL